MSNGLKDFILTAFYAGRSPVAPGTMGTAVAMVLYILENYTLGPVLGDKIIYVNLAIVILLVYPSIRLCDFGEVYYNKKDPQNIVLDEVMGYWTSVLFVPFSLTAAFIAFILFRIFDIIKPFPADNLQSLKGGTGIMIDDYIAGIYACIILNIIVYAARIYGIGFPI